MKICQVWLRKFVVKQVSIEMVYSSLAEESEKYMTREHMSENTWVIYSLVCPFILSVFFPQTIATRGPVSAQEAQGN